MSNSLARALRCWVHSLIQKPDYNEKNNISEGCLSSMSLKKSPFTKATRCPEDTGAVEHMQVGISAAGCHPQTLLWVVASAGYAVQNAAAPYHGGI